MAYLQKAPGKGSFGTIQIGSVKVPVINQEKDEDCGPSCIGLVLRLVGHLKGMQATPTTLRANSQSVGDLGYRPSARDAGATITAGQSLLAAVMKNSLPNQEDSHTGTGAKNLANVLKTKYGFVKANASWATEIKSTLRSASFNNPVIVLCSWEGGGGHFAVVCGYNSKLFGRGAYLITDPYYGAGWLELPRDDNGGIKQPSYMPAQNARGHLNGWRVTVN